MRLLITTALLLAASLVQAHPRPQEQPKALHILRNTAENAVISLPITAKGTLGKGHVALTGGQGDAALNAPNQPAGPDALFSQAPLTVAGDFIFAVNPGSNTLSILKAHRSDPTLLTALSEPVPIPGEFPTTVAASLKNNLVCVGTTGVKAGISCASFSDHGLGPFDSLRPYALNQTTPPTGPPNTVTHALFSDDESHLYTTVKGVPGTTNTGFISVFPVLRDGCRANGKGSKITLGREDIRSSFAATPLLFGAAVIPDSNRVLVTDPSFGAALFDIDASTSKASLISNTSIPDQGATCWASYSAARHSVFVTDVLVNSLVELDAETGAIISKTILPNHDIGYIDLQVVGGLVYALAPGNATVEAAIVVFDAETQRQVQHLEIGAYGADRNAVGVAVL
ncbi:hypothetical protein BJX70DRAFT_361358 [Aspergillus crustosus]